MKNEFIIAIVLLILLIGGVWFVFSQDVQTERLILNDEQNYPDYVEIENPSGFLNTDEQEITIGQYIGEKIVLIDFLTYTCVNCIRTFPYLNDWYEKYEDDGLVIIGIHTPEFAFEKDINNVRKALKKEGIEFPVVLDNDYGTWRAYDNNYWPRKYLIDKNGKIVYDHIGEGAYEETENKIVELLSDLNDTNISKEGETLKQENNLSQVKTRETYLGASRLEYINNLPSTSCLTDSCQYVAPEGIPLNSFSLEGAWRFEPERTVLESQTGSIFLRFSASQVHLVAAGGAQAEIYLDGELVTVESQGEAVTEGRVDFEEEDFYNLIDLQGEYGEHLLEIRILESGFEGFAFTFG